MPIIDGDEVSDRERVLRGFRTGADAVIACWRLWQNRQTLGSRALYDAVNELWATRVLQWEIR